MKKLVPLFALSVAACAPATLDRDLKDIPGLVFRAPQSSRSSGHEAVVLKYDSDEGPCYRIPAGTQLTVNGEAFTLENRGEVYEAVEGLFSCDFPRFQGPLLPPGESLTEYVLSNGKSTLRASFKQLHAARSFRVKVNGTEKTTIRNGSTVDIEWLPVSDRLEGVTVTFEQEGGDSENTYTYTVPATRPAWMPITRASSWAPRAPATSS